MFRLENIKYKNVLYIENLVIPEKKVTCIVGESGSGKTTLLKLLNNMISVDEGRILFGGKPIEAFTPELLRRKVVMLPQNPVIFKGSIRENLQIGLVFSEKPGANNEELLQKLEMVNLKADLDKDAEKLSGGEKQRLALARVLLMDPEVYLLDEPSSALDDNTELFVIGRLVEHIRQKGKTLIMVTHSRSIAEQFSENTIEITGGRLTTGNLQGEGQI